MFGLTCLYAFNHPSGIYRGLMTDGKHYYMKVKLMFDFLLVYIGDDFYSAKKKVRKSFNESIERHDVVWK